jgi:NADH dehydrogenase [ubiquinone] 1 alpha subcomplex assembly factor 7
MSIENEMRKRISLEGYISIDDLMRTAMSASSNAYYRSKQPLGPEADFITSPEISQMFGEMIGLWSISAWERLGRPNPVNLIELGPGRGLLMRDLLRATKKVKEFHDALQIQMLEINSKLIEEQRDRLVGYQVSWISSVNQISHLPSIIIANEFFDALPIRQYIKIKRDWHEVALVIDPDDGMLKFDKRPMMPRIFAGQVNLEHIKARDGAIVEESQESIETMQFISDHIKNFSGAALIIDYGYDISPSLRQDHQYMSTLQAIKGHKFVPVLSSLGDADLSAHVDFYALTQAAKTRMIKVSAIKSQGDFLKSWGIELRLKDLQDKNPELAEVLRRQVHRMIADDTMGKLFKVMELYSRDWHC